MTIVLAGGTLPLQLGIAAIQPDVGGFQGLAADF